MKAIIPLADQTTNSISDKLIPLAGKPLISHLIDQILPLDLEEVIFILPDENKPLIQHIQKHPIKSRFIVQTKKKGNAHAIYGAKKYIDKDFIILFGDVFFKAKINTKTTADGIIWTKEVKDPHQFGVAILDGKQITKLIEKPDDPISNIATIGFYYFKTPELFEHIKFLLEHKIKTKGLYYLTDAIQLFINKEKKIIAKEVDQWYDAASCLFSVNGYLLANNKYHKRTKNNIIIEPVNIAEDVSLTNAIIGPNVSIAEGATIKNSIIKDSILAQNTIIQNALLEKAFLKKYEEFEGSFTN